MTGTHDVNTRQNHSSSSHLKRRFMTWISETSLACLCGAEEADPIVFSDLLSLHSISNQNATSAPILQQVRLEPQNQNTRQWAS
jgi:hypothetical protein